MSRPVGRLAALCRTVRPVQASDGMRPTVALRDGGRGRPAPARPPFRDVEGRPAGVDGTAPAPPVNVETAGGVAPTGRVEAAVPVDKVDVLVVEVALRGRPIDPRRTFAVVGRRPGEADGAKVYGRPERGDSAGLCVCGETRGKPYVSPQTNTLPLESRVW